ncbi:MAG: hypothetical protein U9Q18_03465, partial [Caldisericota bacterium]|nr:hypothetical protein [Caldisericota bacterium]
MWLTGSAPVYRQVETCTGTARSELPPPPSSSSYVYIFGKDISSRPAREKQNTKNKDQAPTPFTSLGGKDLFSAGIYLASEKQNTK